jgi:putative ABC transport system permease protein
MKQNRPPRLARFFLRIQPLGARRRQIDSDFQELFDHRTATRGHRYAAWRYGLDVLSLWRLWSLAGLGRAFGAAVPRRTWVAGAGADIVFATRLFRREPALFSLTVAGVALAIGITTSVFSLVDAVANRSFGIPDPASGYRVNFAYGPSGNGGPWAYADYLKLRDINPSLPIAAMLNGSNQVQLGEPSVDGEERFAPITVVSGGFFDIMGGRAAIGRSLVNDDDRAGAAPAIVLSDRFWRSEFGADPSVIGRTLRLNRAPFTIVGVARRGFTATSQFRMPIGWISLTAYSELQERQPYSKFDRRYQSVDVVATRASAISESKVAATAEAVVAGVAAERGLVDPGNRPRVVIADLVEQSGDASFAAFGASIIMVVVGLILALASVNIANLLLASAAARSREIGVRLTLGASRIRIVRQLLTESLLLGLLGGAAGLTLALWTAPVLAQVLNFPETLQVSPGTRVLGFSVVVTVVVGLVAGLAPARYGRRGELLSSINAETPAATSGRSGRLHTILIGSQAAASIVLLVGAALFVRSLVEVVNMDLGLKADRLVMVSLSVRKARTDAVARAALDAAQERLRQAPGVTGVSLTLLGPFEGSYAPMSVGPQSGRTLRGYLRGEPALQVMRHETSADYFETIGARIIRGRSYTADEAKSTAPVAVISESLARRFWPHEDPIGSSLTRVWGEEIPATGRAQGFLRKPVGTRVIGVVSESVTRLRSYDSPALYLPLDPLEGRTPRLIVRTTGDPRGALRGIRDALKSIDPDLGIRTQFVSDGLQDELRTPKAFALVAGVIGVSTLILAVIGLFGVTAFVVRQRRREVSVRLAMGATGRDVVTLLLRDSLRPVLVGMICGLFVALLGGHVIRGLLYGVRGYDPLAVSSAIGILLLATAAAALGPALRALRVDPAEMLKQS